jgi:mono/diheme cytochrome c family protein/uncharacterized membrane protein
MGTRRSALHRGVLAVPLVLLGLGGWQLCAPTRVRAQADSSRSPQRPAPGPSGQAAPGAPASRALYRQHCLKCHGADGTGNPGRGLMPEIPSFTDASWQAQRSDAQLLASILDGKGADMPPGRGKIPNEQARGLVAYVRAFGPTKGSSRDKGKPKEGASSGADFRRLQDQLDQLKRQFRHLSEASPDRKPPEPSGPPPPAAPPKPSPTQPHAAPRPPGQEATGAPDVSALFRQHCLKCHGADGTGSPVRGRLPAVPNFTDASWQARRTDAQLLASILDGKGVEMPPWRKKISGEQARSLVAHVRAFAPTTGKAGQEDQAQPTPAEPADQAEPPKAFFEKLIGWLGRFHPSAVHFPIALLTAAAVAELLGMATGKPAFDAVSRYCVWFGARTAVVAGVLGWFLGGFRLADASWVMMTHRWLGTSTVTGAGLILLVSEASRRTDRRRTRTAFRITLLVVAVLVLVTGFFGGAVSFGLDHYAWPS